MYFISSIRFGAATWYQHIFCDTIERMGEVLRLRSYFEGNFEALIIAINDYKNSLNALLFTLVSEEIIVVGQSWFWSWIEFPMHYACGRLNEVCLYGCMYEAMLTGVELSLRNWLDYSSPLWVVSIIPWWVWRSSVWRQWIGDNNAIGSAVSARFAQLCARICVIPAPNTPVRPASADVIAIEDSFAPVHYGAADEGFLRPKVPPNLPKVP